MGELEQAKKDSLSGNLVSSARMRKLGNAIKAVGSFLKSRRRRPLNYVLKIPLNRPIGKRFYTVHLDAPVDSVTFTKRKDADAIKKLLAVSTAGIKGDIVRREVTEEGYIPTYPGDGK